MAELAAAVLGFLTALIGLITAIFNAAESRRQQHGKVSSSSVQRGRAKPSHQTINRRMLGGVALLVIGILIGSLGVVGLNTRKPRSSFPELPASSPPPNASAPSTFPARSSTAYDVDADSQKGAKSHQIDQGGWVDQRFLTRPGYRIEEILVIPGVDSTKTDPKSVGPLRLELYEDGIVRFRDDEVKFVNNEGSGTTLAQPLVMRGGSTYSFRVTNTTGKTIGLYIKHIDPRIDRNATTFQGSIDTPDGIRKGLELSGLVRVRPV